MNTYPLPPVFGAIRVDAVIASSSSYVMMPAPFPHSERQDIQGHPFSGCPKREISVFRFMWCWPECIASWCLRSSLRCCLAYPEFVHTVHDWLVQESRRYCGYIWGYHCNSTRKVPRYCWLDLWAEWFLVNTMLGSCKGIFECSGVNGRFLIWNSFHVIVTLFKSWSVELGYKPFSKVVQKVSVRTELIQ